MVSGNTQETPDPQLLKNYFVVLKINLFGDERI